MSHKFTYFRIVNIMGVSEVEVDGDDVILVQGPNGSGKSSIIEALNSVLKGGHDRELLTIGEDEGEIYIRVEDGTEVHKRVGSQRSPLTVRNEHGRIHRAKEWLMQHFDMMTVNAVEWLEADRKTRVRLIAEGLGERLDVATLDAKIGTEMNLFRFMPADSVANDVQFQRPDDMDTAVVSVDTSAPGIRILGKFIEYLMEWRLKIGQTKRAKRDSAKELRETLPADLSEVRIPEKIAEEKKELNDRLTTLSAKEADEIDVARAKHDTYVEERLADVKSKMDATQSELNNLDVRRRDLQARIAELNEQKAQVRDDLDTAWNAQTENIRNEHTTERDQIGTDQVQLTNDLRAAERQKKTLELIEKYDEEHKEFEDRQSLLTDAIAYVREHQARLLGSLNIPGVGIAEDGEIVVDGVRFEKLNTADENQDRVLDIADSVVARWRSSTGSNVWTPIHGSNSYWQLRRQVSSWL